MLVLTSLTDGEKHGYAIMPHVEHFADVFMGPGTLYGALNRLEAEGLVEPLPADERRQPCALTSKCRVVLAACLHQWQALEKVGLGRL